ncbi:uncharacterized protein LOC127566432 isoform X7 [Pristis pectinata]|uniref:uncharacterized protein LOC127566432 isoform X1 n=1 Tax=Pristis pectinata TaxID=685728 RepID=UPI00223DEAA5|nr:uncharacterized protein LOC127566432 isoform X1 [Pristis pectinata]XP_051864790.1 uncharacterized protein LOC127566432 isoform X2 [Pristis pectinata]XP_051864791.1 uncharacterized protein LOC127566432 isoform X3 [Pristis pectinata]XP_051864792.1 uncharacterized protein LOC127566432 isoform X4 [Pristis pectinata]XP_051864793.1 uncharacterized protein LOC127566432 isoform X5 [Pristis pectinata]XP_051864794.1 uncharacterized protein LOC127566432 isoform X6 [Pristis pectinata]XP_051864795.1 un
MNLVAYFLLFVLPMVHRSAAQELGKLRLLPDREDKIYLKGESVTFRCEADRALTPRGFSLYGGGHNLEIKPQAASSLTKAVTFTITDMQYGPRNYMCFYSSYVTGATSARSDEVEITVVGPPAKPQLSNDRANKTFVAGEEVIFICATSYSVDSNNGFALYRDVQPVLSKPRDSGWVYGATFTIRVTGCGSQNYYCVQTCRVSGRNISSQKSEPVKITVVGPPPKPLLTTDGADKTFVLGEEVIFTCAAIFPRQWNSSFVLYRDEQPVLSKPRDSGWVDGVKFTIRITSSGSQNYHCVQMCLVSGRNVSSEKSEPVKLTVVEKAFQAWMPALGVLALIPVSVLLGICCWRKGKSRSHRRMRTTAPPQDQIYESVDTNVTDQGETRTPPSDEDQINCNILYADLNMKPQPKEHYVAQENFKIPDDDGTVYASVKL